MVRIINKVKNFRTEKLDPKVKTAIALDLKSKSTKTIAPFKRSLVYSYFKLYPNQILVYKNKKLKGWSDLIRLDSNKYATIHLFKNLKATIIVEDDRLLINVNKYKPNAPVKSLKTETVCVGTFSTIFGITDVYCNPFKGLRQLIRLIGTIPFWAAYEYKNCYYDKQFRLQCDNTFKVSETDGSLLDTINCHEVKDLKDNQYIC